jgi:hypothetical protein
MPTRRPQVDTPLVRTLLAFKMELDLTSSKEEVWLIWQQYLPLLDRLSRNARDDLAEAVTARIREFDDPEA